jgi:hypothetical protein
VKSARQNQKARLSTGLPVNEQRLRSEFGRQIAVDLEANADLNECRSRPGHALVNNYTTLSPDNGLAAQPCPSEFCSAFRSQPAVGTGGTIGLAAGLINELGKAMRVVLLALTVMWPLAAQAYWVGTARAVGGPAESRRLR